MVCGTKESSNQFQSKHKQKPIITTPRSNLVIKVKNSKPQAKDKERRKTKHTKK